MIGFDAMASGVVQDGLRGRCRAVQQVLLVFLRQRILPWPPAATVEPTPLSCCPAHLQAIGNHEFGEHAMQSAPLSALCHQATACNMVPGLWGAPEQHNIQLFGLALLQPHCSISVCSPADYGPGTLAGFAGALNTPLIRCGLGLPGNAQLTSAPPSVTTTAAAAAADFAQLNGFRGCRCSRSFATAQTSN